MARTIKTGLIITGDAKGGVSALKLTDDQLKGLNSTQKKAATQNKATGTSFGDATKKAAAYGAAAALAAGAGIALLVKQQLASIDSTAKIADKLGIATESLTAMRIQAELTGVATTTLDMGLQRMVRRVAEAGQGTGEAASALKELNINAVELAKLSPDKQFAAIGDAMADVGSQSDRVRLAFKLFDSGGVALLNTLKGGSAAAAEAAAFTEQWGLAINRVDSAKVEQANDAMAKVGQASEGLWKQLTVKVSPALVGIANEMLGVGDEMGTAKETADALFDGMITGISFAADAARGLQVVWKGVTVIVAQALNGILHAVASVDRAITTLLNKMPEFAGGGEFTESAFLQNVSAAVSNTAAGLTKELKELTEKSLPSASIKKWLKKTEDEVQKTAEKIAADANVSTELIGENINSLPDTLETSTAKMVATVQRDAPKAANVYVTAWDKAIERVDESFANAWKGSFDSFSSFADGIKDSFKTLLAELAHLAITKPILIGLGLGGSGAASAGGGGSLLSSVTGGGGGSSVFDLISSGKSLLNLNASITGAIDGVVNGLFNAGFQDAAIGLGNYTQGITGASGGIGGAAGGIGLSLAAGFAGNYAGNQIGESLFGKTANSNYGALAGGLVGSIFGPLGTLGGSALGGLLDSAFGGDGKKRVALGVRTGADVAPGAAGQIQGGSGLLFTGYQKRTGKAGEDATIELVNQFASLDTSLTNLYGLLGDSIDLTGQSLVGKAHQAGKNGGDFFGSAAFNKVDNSQLASAADTFLAAWHDAITGQVDSVIDLTVFKDLQGQGESLSAAINRVQIEFVAVTGALDSLGLELIDLSVGGLAAADGIVQAFGGLDKLGSGVTAYYDAFFTDGEKLEKLGASLTKQFSALGVAMPKTRDGFRQIVDGLDLTRAASQKLFADLINLAPALSQYLTAQSEIVTGNIGESLADLSSDILGRYEDEKEAVGEVGEARIQALRAENSEMQRIAGTLSNSVARSKLSSLSPLTNKGRLDFAQSQYQSVLAAAQGGDLAAAGNLGGARDDYLSEAARFFASSGDYTKIFNNTEQSLTELSKKFSTQSDTSAQIAKIQTGTLSATLQLGSTALDQLKEMVAMTAGIDSVAELLAVLPQSLSGKLSGVTGVGAADLSSDPIYKLYADSLGRDPDAEGYAYWQNQIDSGTSSSQVETDFYKGAIAELYTRGLGRDPDAEGYAYWQNQIDSGTSFEQLKAEFFKAAGLNNEGTINQFAVGTSFVSRDQTAGIHQGEMIIDRQSSDVLRKYGINVGAGKNNDALLSEIKALRAEVAGLRSERATDAQHASTQRNQQQNSIERSGRQAVRSKVKVLS